MKDRAHPVKPHHWHEAAACVGVDPEEFFPADSTKRVPLLVQQCCGRCEVKAECLADALKAEELTACYGIRAGLLPEQRNAILRRRGISKPVNQR